MGNCSNATSSMQPSGMYPQVEDERLLLEALLHFAYLSITSLILSLCDCLLLFRYLSHTLTCQSPQGGHLETHV